MDIKTHSRDKHPFRQLRVWRCSQFLRVLCLGSCVTLRRLQAPRDNRTRGSRRAHAGRTDLLRCSEFWLKALRSTLTWVGIAGVICSEQTPVGEAADDASSRTSTAHVSRRRSGGATARGKACGHPVPASRERKSFNALSSEGRPDDRQSAKEERLQQTAEAPAVAREPYGKIAAPWLDRHWIVCGRQREMHLDITIRILSFVRQLNNLCQSNGQKELEAWL
jgi:hypothetical protein